LSRPKNSVSVGKKPPDDMPAGTATAAPLTPTVISAPAAESAPTGTCAFHPSPVDPTVIDPRLMDLHGTSTSSDRARFIAAVGAHRTVNVVVPIPAIAST